MVSRVTSPASHHLKASIVERLLTAISYLVHAVSLSHSGRATLSNTSRLPIVRKTLGHLPAFTVDNAIHLRPGVLLSEYTYGLFFQALVRLRVFTYGLKTIEYRRVSL